MYSQIWNIILKCYFNAFKLVDFIVSSLPPHNLYDFFYHWIEVELINQTKCAWCMIITNNTFLSFNWMFICWIDAVSYVVRAPYSVDVGRNNFFIIKLQNLSHFLDPNFEKKDKKCACWFRCLCFDVQRFKIWLVHHLDVIQNTTIKNQFHE